MLNWGIMGAGGIAYVFCNGLRFSKTGQAVAVGSYSQARASKLANDFGIPRQHTSYEALLADEGVEAVYISTIHPFHAEWAIKAAAAGKHILVEKPIGMTAAEAEAMLEAARVNNVFLMEAFMYRCHPQMRKLTELIRVGAIGQVQLIRAVFGFRAEFDPASRTFNNEMGGGGILDVGCYPASVVRLIAGAAENKSFLDPQEIKACGNLGPTGVDHLTAATLRFENGIIAEMITAVDCEVPGNVTVYGTAGILTVPNPWLPSTPCRNALQPLPLDTPFPPATLLLQTPGQPPTEISVPADRDLFTYEADMVADHIEARQAPAMLWDDTLGNMRLLDRWRAEIGLVYYNQEK
jgi:predicted dehydrogenase